MGTMSQQWKIDDISKKIGTVVNNSLENMTQAIYMKCLEFAALAKSAHTYRNYKGELESSVGVVVLKDREEVKEWKSMADTGTDPSLGISDFTSTLQEYVIGKATLPDGTEIPPKGITGIVFAAAPYAGYVESGEGMGLWGRGGMPKKVLNAFAPKGEDVFRILKVFTS